MRCWGLWHYNDCDDILRPAYGGAASGSSVEELTAAAFEKLLSDTLRPAQDSMGMGGYGRQRKGDDDGVPQRKPAFRGLLWILGI